MKVLEIHKFIFKGTQGLSVVKVQQGLSWIRVRILRLSQLGNVTVHHLCILIAQPHILILCLTIIYIACYSTLIARLTVSTWVYFYILAFLFLSQFTANSQYIHNTYTNVRRPPLPDYHSATQMAQVARQRHKQWAGSSKFYREEESNHSQGMCMDLKCCCLCALSMSCYSQYKRGKEKIHQFMLYFCIAL